MIPSVKELTKKYYKILQKQELQEVLKFPIEIFWNLEAKFLQ